MAVIGYREVGPRLYEVALVHGPIRSQGRAWPCGIRHQSQQLEISDDVPDFDREALADELALLASQALASLSNLQLLPVPFVGPVS